MAAPALCFRAMLRMPEADVSFFQDFTMVHIADREKAWRACLCAATFVAWGLDNLHAMLISISQALAPHIILYDKEDNKTVEPTPC